jgi:glycine reductase
MKMELLSYEVKDVVLGDKTLFEDNVLTISEKEIIEMIDLSDLGSLEIKIARKGENKRIIHILDAVKPVHKSEGKTTAFPGILGEPLTVGTGKTHQLNGVAVMSCGIFEQADDPILRVREAMVDMRGEKSYLSPFSNLTNIVVEMKIKKDVELKVADASVRKATAKIAEYLASMTAEVKPDSIEEISYSDSVEGLPNTCLILQLASIGTLFDSYLYGRTVDGILPTLIHMNELTDGAVMTDDYFYGGQRNPSYFYQENPIVKKMYERHGKDLNFKGVILTRGYYNTLDDKKRAANYCAKLAALIGADGAVITIEEGGNSHTDAMLTCQACEQMDISTSIIVGEMGDIKSTEFSLVDYVPEATAMVSSGNREDLIELPYMDEVLGGETFIETGECAKQAQKVPLNHFLCSNSQVGAWNVTMEEY